MQEQSTTEILQQFSSFVIDLRAQQNAGTVGFEGDSIAQIIGLQAQALAEKHFIAENAFSLLTHCAKMVIGFTIASEQGAMPAAACQENIALVIVKVAEALDS